MNNIYIAFICIQIFVIGFQDNLKNRLCVFRKRRPVFRNCPYTIYIYQIRHSTPWPCVVHGIKGISIVVAPVQDYIAFSNCISAYQNRKIISVSAVNGTPLEKISATVFHGGTSERGINRCKSRIRRSSCHYSSQS